MNYNSSLGVGVKGYHARACNQYSAVLTTSVASDLYWLYTSSFDAGWQPAVCFKLHHGVCGVPLPATSRLRAWLHGHLCVHHRHTRLQVCKHLAEMYPVQVEGCKTHGIQQQLPSLRGWVDQSLASLTVYISCLVSLYFVCKDAGYFQYISY